jgi:hypothetical protein
LRLKIAIIGAGIGGSSLAYYLGKKGEYDITIFESRNEVGGRIRNVKIEDKIVETGAGFFHSVNQNILSLTDALHLEKVELVSENIGLYDGRSMLYQTSKSKFWSKMQLLFRFGLNLLKLQAGVKLVKSKVTSFYSEDEPFQSIPEMINHMGFGSIYINTIEKQLLEMGINEKIIADLAIPANRTIYHQCGDRQMNGFAGFVSLIASDNQPIYYIKNGNKTLCQKLIEKSGAKLHLEKKVSRISQIDGGYSVEVNGKSQEFDIIVIATPLEVGDIEINNVVDMADIPSYNREFVPYTKTIVAGEINPSYFGVKEAPDMIMTTENSTAPMKGMNKNCTTSRGVTVWTLSGEDSVCKEELNKMFVEISEVHYAKVPYTYPNLSPIPFDKFPPLILGENLYYANGIDTLSPTMESSIIVAKNISRLIQ